MKEFMMADETKRETRESEEFYEAMPGTMDRRETVQRDYTADERDDDAARPSLLPWLLIPAALLLGWMLLNALNNNDTNNTGTTGQTQQQTDTENAPAAGGDLTQ
jgi:hypothetical protein